MPEDENQAEETTALEPTKEPIEELSKTEEPAVVDKPVIETPLPPETTVEVPLLPIEETPAPLPPETMPEPAPSPEPEPIIENPVAPVLPKVEPKPDSKPAPEPEPIPKQEPEGPEVEKPKIVKPVELPATPAVAPTPQVVPPTTPPVVPTPAVAPAKHDPKYTKDIPKRVLELTDEEINAARKLWAREHIDGARNKANANRHEHMNEMLNQIEAVVKASPNTTTHKIANSLNISEQMTSGYLQKLVKARRIKASGNSRNRRYFG